MKNEFRNWSKLSIPRSNWIYSYILSHMRSLLSHNWIFFILRCLGMWKDVKFGEDEIMAPPSGMSLTRPKLLSNSTSSATLQQFLSVLCFTLSLNSFFPVVTSVLLDNKQSWILRNVIFICLYFKTTSNFIIIFVKSYSCEVLIVSPSWISLAVFNRFLCVKSLSITEAGSLSVERYELYIGINSMMFTAKKMKISIAILIFLFIRLPLKQQNRLLK